MAERTGRCLRILLLARASGPEARLRDGQGSASLPLLDPVGLVALVDEVRPEVALSVSRFQADGVSLKVLSGDDPRTVAALAARAGLDPGEPVTGTALTLVLRLRLLDRIQRLDQLNEPVACRSAATAAS